MDGVFTEEELKASEQQPGQEAEGQEQQQGGTEGEEQKQDRPRRADGTFMSAEEIAAQEGQQGGESEGGEEAKQKTVPQQALHAEREKRKALEAEIAPLKEQLAALAKMREQIASRKPADLPAADDPAAIEHLRNRLAELESGQTRITQHMDGQAVAEAERQELGGFVAKDEAAYRQQQPDYDEAISHVVQARAKELALYGLNPAQIAQTISEEATEIARSAIAQNRSPAELGYQIALSRGYQPKAKQQEGGEQQQPPAKSAAQATLDAIAEARKQGKSLGGAGGSTPKMLNAETVLAMSPEEFDALYSTPEGKAMIDAL